MTITSPGKFWNLDPSLRNKLRQLKFKDGKFNIWMIKANKEMFNPDAHIMWDKYWPIGLALAIDYPEYVGSGVYIRQFYRGKGLGSTLLKYVVGHYAKPVIFYPDPKNIGFFQKNHEETTTKFYYSKDSVDGWRLSNCKHLAVDPD